MILCTSTCNLYLYLQLKVHKHQEEMMEDIPKEIVPPEYGGTGSTVEEITGKPLFIPYFYNFKGRIPYHFMKKNLAAAVSLLSF